MVIKKIIALTLVLCIIYDECGSKIEKIFKEEESIEILKIIG